MTSLLSVHKDIRRALQAPLFNAAVAAKYVDDLDVPLIQWKGLPFDTNNRPSWMAVEMIFADVIVHEVGPDPMIEGPGAVNIVIRSPLNLGEDGNDALLGIIDTAYPYASTPSFGGVVVNIDKSQHRGYGSDGPWLTGQVSVDWNIYRRS